MLYHDTHLRIVPVAKARTERGASAVEYALITLLIAVVIIAAVTLVGGKTADLFQRACQSVPSYTTGSGC
ncbi:MAG: Flp family type IVb pilin [Nocardioidaceae bacterium]